MTISEIIAPIGAQQILVPQPPLSPTPRLEYFDQRLLEVIREEQSMPVWTLLGVVADGENPASRNVGRMLRLQLWGKLRRLLRLELVFRDGRKAVSATKPPPTPRRPRRSWAGRRSVQLSTAVGQGSTRFLLKSDVTEAHQQKPDQQQQEGNCPTSERPQEPAKFKCDPVHHEAGPQTSDGQTIRDAAKELVALRGKRKQWTGFIGRVRLYRGQWVRLPSGQIIFVYGCRRGWLVYTDTAGKLLGGFGDPLQWGVVKVEKVILIKSSAAVVLGSAKRGRTERPSALKARAARINGTLPCHTGKRRGRPRGRG